MDRHAFALALALLPLVVTAAPRMLPREWGRAIPLKSVVVIAPADGPAQQLRQALETAGAQTRVLSPTDALDTTGLRWKAEVAASTVVLLGGIHTNPALLPLYAHYLSFADAVHPGGEGFAIRTVDRPFGEGTAAIALEASGPEGEAKAVARFGELLGQVTAEGFAATLEAHLSPEREALVRGIGDRGMRWALGGIPGDAAAGMKALLAAMDPQTGFAKFGDYGIERYIREAWYLQDGPGISPEDQLRLDQGLLATCVATQNEWWRRKDGSIIGGRHQTMGTSAFTAAVQVLRRCGKPNEEARELLDQWWTQCEAYWRNACSTFHDDLEGIPVYYCPEPTLDWALMMGFDGYVSEQLPKAALRAYGVVDNLGYYAGTGTYEECRPGDLYKQVPWGWILRATSYFHPAKGFDWLQQHLPHAGVYCWALGRQVAGARTFATGTQDIRPDALLGLTVTSLGEYRWRQLSHNRDDARARGQRYITAPEERCFEKLCFRDSFEPTGQYLALEGYATAAADNQPPLDPNSIIRYTDLGHIWLHSNTEKSGNLPRSAVICTDGMNESPMPAGCELQALHNGAQVGLVASHFPDYVACDWTRNVIWRRGKYFVVIDLLQQTREGKFGLICSFRTPQRAWLQPDGMLAREGDGEMRVLCAGSRPLEGADTQRLGTKVGIRLALEGGHELEGAAVPTLLRETQLLDGGVGTVKTFRNLIFSRDPAHPADLEVRALGETEAMVCGTARGEEELALIAAAPKGQGITAGAFETDGQVLYVGGAGWAQAGGTGLSVGGQRVAGSEGETTEAMREQLRRLWATAASPPVAEWHSATPPVSRNGAARKEGETATAGQTGLSVPQAAVWRCAPFSHLDPPVAAPIVTSDPPAKGLVGSLFDGVIERHATVTWPGPGPARLTLDLRESRPITQVDFSAGTFGPYNTIPDPATYPGPRKAVAELSDDGFAADRRQGELTFTSDCTFENQHKGSVWPTLRWTTRDLGGARARYLRLTFGDEWKSGLGMGELCVRQQGENWAQIVGLVQRDITADGAAEILAWSDQGELAAIGQGGAVLWRHPFPGYITAVESYGELGGDGPRVLVATREARLYCLDRSGTELWKTDFLESAKLNGDLPIAYSIGLLKTPEGKPLIVTGNYNLACFVSPDGQVLKYERLPAAFQTMTLRYGADYDGDGREETVSTEVWGCLSVLSADMKRKAGCGLPRGKGIALRYWEPPSPGATRILVCTENGVGLLDAKTLKYDWLHGVTPINDCTVGEVDGDGAQEIVLAKADGYVLVYGEDGRLKQSVLVGESVRAVATIAVGGRRVLVAALPGRVARFGERLGEWTAVAEGEYARLEATAKEAEVLAVREGAVVEGLRL